MRKRLPPSLDEDLSEEPLINLTPLIDVVFVVLITFMLIAPILSTDSVLLAPGKSSTKNGVEASQKQRLLISIQSDNQIRWREKPIRLDELKKLLLAERKNHPQIIPQLIPDARSHFETYQQVKNLLEECGFEQMEILLRPS